MYSYICVYKYVCFLVLYIRLLEDVGMFLLYSVWLHVSGYIARETWTAIYHWRAERKSATSLCYRLARWRIRAAVTQQWSESRFALMSTGPTTTGFISGLFRSYLATQLLSRFYIPSFGVCWPSGTLSMNNEEKIENCIFDFENSL